MTAPASRVFSSAIATHLAPVPNSLYPAAQAAGSLDVLAPQPVQHPSNFSGGDRGHGQPAQDGAGVGPKRAAPLLPVLGISPTRGVVRQKLGNRLIPGHAAGLFKAEASPVS